MNAHVGGDGLSQLRLALRRQGYRPVPISGPHMQVRDAGKRPLLKNWAEICASADEETIRGWSLNERNCTSTGLLCGVPEKGGSLAGLDIDVLDEHLAGEMEATAQRELGITPLRRIGRAPKALLCFRTPEPLDKIQTPELVMPGGQIARVELLGRGQQFVGFGTHPGTGKPYEWTESDPRVVRLDALPLVSEEALRGFLSWCEDLLRRAGAETRADIRAREREGRAFARMGNREKASIEDVTEALRHIPNDELSYDEWVRVGLALYGAVGDAGRDLFEDWSVLAGKNDPERTAEKWPTFADVSEIGAGTIFWLARQGGWRRKAGKAAGPEPGVVIHSAGDLGTMDFPEIRYVVPGYIVEGLTLFAGKPKIGKSWFCLDVALAVASGGTCLGDVKCAQGAVLYLALEDNPRRLQRRMKALMPFVEPKDWPALLHYTTEFPRGEKALTELRAWLEATPSARLIIVDVLAAFRERRGNQEAQYDADYQAIKALQALAGEFGIAILVVHHTRKSSADTDALDKVSGTLGLSGGADTTLILDRGANGVTLYGRGRDIEEIETAVAFDRDAFRWRLLGDATEVRRSDERQAIIDALRASAEPMSPKEIAEVTGIPHANVKHLVLRMARDGDIERAERGNYRITDVTRATESDISVSETPDFMM